MKKKKLAVIIIGVILGSCTQTDRLSELKSPVVIVGLQTGEHDVVTLRDSVGTIFTSWNTAFAMSMQCRSIGDTIK